MQDYLRSKIPELPHDLDIVIRIYGNMYGLNKTYCDADILEHREMFARFVRGFNMAHPLCDFVDAGNRKECSDVKIRGKSLNPSSTILAEAPLGTHYDNRNYEAARGRPSL